MEELPPHNSLSDGDESLSAGGNKIGYKDTILEVSKILNKWVQEEKIDLENAQLLYLLCDDLLITARNRLINLAVPVFVKLICKDKNDAAKLFISFVKFGENAKVFFGKISKKNLDDLTWFFNMLVEKFGLK